MKSHLLFLSSLFIFLISFSCKKENHPPVINDQVFSVKENSIEKSVVATISATDPDDDALHFQLISTDDNFPFLLDETSGNLKLKESSKLNFEEVQQYIFKVGVTDNSRENEISEALVTINIEDVKEIPVFDVQSFTIKENSPNGTLVGIIVFQKEDKNQALDMKIESGNVNDAFAINQEGKITINAEDVVDFEFISKFELNVKLTDKSDASVYSSAIVTINIEDVKEAPVFNAQTFTVKENLPNGTLVGIINYQKKDKDQVLDMKIESGNVNNAFAIDQEGKITINAEDIIDFELFPQFELNVRLTDKSDANIFSSAIITIKLEDQAENPNVRDQEFSILENLKGLYSIGIIQFQSKNTGGNYLFSIVEGNTDNLFFIGQQSGELFLNNDVVLNFEDASDYTIRVKVQDKQNSSLYTNISIKINVLDINERPTISNQEFTVHENSVNDFEVGVLKASDIDNGQKLTFEIIESSIENVFKVEGNSGKLLVNDQSKLDYETTTEIRLKVKVTDDGENALSDTADVNIRILDVNENPVFSDLNFQVNENSVAGTKVGNIEAKSYSGNPVEFEVLAGTGFANFYVEKSTGEITVAQSGVLNFESKNNYTLQVRAYEVANPDISTTATLTIELLDVNEAPVISDQEFSTYSTNQTGSVVGKVLAVDPDNNQILTYEIVSGNDDGYFTIDSSNGNIFINNTISPGNNSEISFVLKIQVKDNVADNELWAAALITVVVKNTIPTSGLVAYFPFNGNAVDESNNSYDGSVIGSVLTTDRKGKANSAYLFDGLNDQIAIGSQVGNSIRTISLWFLLDEDIDSNISNPKTIIAREGDFNNYTEFSLAFITNEWGPAGKLRFFYSIHKDDYYSVYSNSSTWAKNTWYHVVITLDSTKGMQMYINNVCQNDTGNYYDATENSSLNTYIGSWGSEPNRYFPGKIDDVIFYNRTISEQEIGTLYNF